MSETKPQSKSAYKLIGQNYATPDLVAKVTGRAKSIRGTGRASALDFEGFLSTGTLMTTA